MLCYNIIKVKENKIKQKEKEKTKMTKGQIALACLTERMADISGMNERYAAGVHVVGKEDVEGFLDFLKEILS